MLEIDVNQKHRSSAAHNTSDARGADEAQQTICSARSDNSRAALLVGALTVGWILLLIWVAARLFAA